MKTDALRRKLKNDRAAAIKAAAALAERADDDLGAASELEFALGRVEQLDRRLKMAPRLERIKEPDLYERGSPHGFFRDIVASVAPMPVPGADTTSARDRLMRHQAREAETRQATRGIRDAAAISHGVQWQGGQSRALSSLAGAGGEFLPPRWLLRQFASVARASAPLRRLVTAVPLPDGTLELHLPRVTAVSGVVGPDPVENTNPEQVQAATDAIVAPVRTFAGEVPVSQALYERGPDFDGLLTNDFAASYAAALEQQLVNGTGTNGQLLGLLSVPTASVDGVPGATLATYTAATPTTAGMVSAIAQLAADVADARERPPSFVLMRPSRYFWLAGSADGSGSVSTERVGTGYQNAKGPDDGPFGPIAGLPVYLDATVPTNMGSGSQDTAIVALGRDILLLEGEPTFTALVDTAGGAAELTVVLQYHTYAAAFTTRYPSGIGSVTGTGFALPSGW